MKLKTSFSDYTTFKKDITRFLPLWLLYLIGSLVVLLDSKSGSSYDHFAASFMTMLIPSFGIVNLIYAGICALLLFGDLYNTRMCYSLHTVPMRREGLYASHWCAALCFSLVPNFVVGLFLMTQLEAYWFLALYWLLASTLQFLFFFGLASVSAMLTGNRFAALLVYAGFNFISMLAYWVVGSVYLPRMTGVYVSYAPFFLLCPVVQLFRNYEFFTFQPEVVPQLWDSTITKHFYRYTGLGSGWGYLAIMGVLGIALAGLAIWLYRKRHLESAGDFIAFPKLKNPACVIITVCVTAVFALLPGWMFGGSNSVWAIVGLVIGFFGSLMLLERRIKVFRLKTILGFILTAVLLVSSLLVVEFDLFNIVNWTPKADRVESVTLSNGAASDLARGMDPSYRNSITATLTAPEEIQEVIEVHETILENLDQPSDGDRLNRVTLSYQMKDGRTVLRSYLVPQSSPAWKTIRKYLYSTPNIMGYTDWETYVSNVKEISIYGEQVPTLYYRELLEALRADCNQGYVGNEVDEWYTAVDIRFTVESGISGHRNLGVSMKAANTVALMESPGFLMGYKDWDTFLAGSHRIHFNGMEVPAPLIQQFLEALRKDCENGNAGFSFKADGAYSLELYSLTDEGSHSVYLTLNGDAQNVLDMVEILNSGSWKE